MIWFLALVGFVPLIGAATDTNHNHDSFYTMVGHLAILGTTLLTYAQTRSNGAKLKAAKVALDEKEP